MKAIQRTVVFLAVLISTILMSSCLNPVEPEGDQSDAIREAVLRYQFEWFGNPVLFRNFYIAVSVSDSVHQFRSDADPSGPLLKAFASHLPPVKKFSDAKIVQGQVLDKQTSENGVLFRVAQIQWKSPSAVSLDGGDYFGGRGADTFLYHVTRKNGAWSVDSTRYWWGA